MVRKQVYIEEWQEEMLKRLARKLKVPQSALIRRGIEASLASAATPSRDLSAWEEFKRTALSRRPAKNPKKRSWKRDDLYDRGKNVD